MKTQDDVETVLLVEDTEDNRFMMRRLLEMSGYRVVEARNGEEAVRTAEAQEPELILMDLSLPVLDGWAATRQLKAAQHTRHIPVIALTANAMTGDREKALAAGCDDFDTKPIVMPRLLEKIRALSGSQAG